MRTQFQSRMLGAILGISGMYLFLSILGALIPGLQAAFLLRLLGVPGSFLLTSFSYASLYAPLYLLGNGYLVFQGRDTRQGFFLSSLAFLPMISLAVVFRLLLDDIFNETLIGAFLTVNFSLSGALIISSTLTLAFLLLILRSALAMDIPELESAENSNPAQDPMEDAPVLREPVRLLNYRPSSGDPLKDFLGTEMSRFQYARTDQDDEGDPELLPALHDSDEYSEAGSDDADFPDWRSETDMQMDLGYQDRGNPMDTAAGEADEDSWIRETLALAADPEPGESGSEPEIIRLNFRRNPDAADPREKGVEAGSARAHDREQEPAQFEREQPEAAEDPDEQGYDALQDAALLLDDPEEAEEDYDLPVNEDLLPHAEPETELNFSRKAGPYEIPIDGVLQKQSREAYWIIDQPTTDQAQVLRNTLQEFGIEAEVTGIRKGPVITMFEILPAPGVKLARIVNLADNIALSLAAASVRIVAPIPGKHAVGIEVPNKKRHLVTFSEILNDDEFMNGEAAIPVALGKDITGEAQIEDLTRMPHLLIAGATGAGKSVCVNSLISSILYRRDPDEVKMILIDPKIVELKFYNDIPHLLTPVITDPKRAFQALQWCLFEMERRYSLLDAMAVRDVKSYNRKIVEKKIATTRLPYIVVVVDEFADLMATSGKELESTLARLAAMSRAVGIHLVLATQRPSTDVITGLIKANIPSRIAFMVASKVDSRIIIDAGGAEKLLGKGDMLFTSAWDPFPKRIQGAFLSESEVESIVAHVKEMGSPDYIDDEIFIEEDDADIVHGELDDPLMEKAIEIVCSANKASASYLQRRLSIGYNRAARLIEEMEEMGIVGPQNGSKPRDILRSREML